MRTLIICYTVAVALGSYSAHATDTKESLVFYEPFSVVEMAERVQERKDALRVEQFHTSITVQYGTRIEWTNACAWLEAQTDGVSRYYVPPQHGIVEYNYCCMVFRTYRDVSVDSLSGLHTLMNEFTNQFGGAIMGWRFYFRDFSEDESDAGSQ